MGGEEKPKSPTSSETNEDSSGVFVEPNMKVKDIRAMFRGGPDYENFAKPRPMFSSGRKRNKSSRTNSMQEGSTNIQAGNEASPTSPVSRQVMGLFQGAFEMEKELVSKAENASLQTKEEDHPVPPPRNPHNRLTKKVESKPVQSKSESEVLSSQEGNGDFKESIARIKSESDKIESYEQSLDEFYDVFNNLQT